MFEFSVLPANPEQDERWFLSFEEAANYARQIHLYVNRYVHVWHDGNRTGVQHV